MYKINENVKLSTKENERVFKITKVAKLKGQYEITLVGPIDFDSEGDLDDIFNKTIINIPAPFLGMKK